MERKGANRLAECALLAMHAWRGHPVMTSPSTPTTNAIAYGLEPAAFKLSHLCRRKAHAKPAQSHPAKGQVDRPDVESIETWLHGVFDGFLDVEGVLIDEVARDCKAPPIKIITLSGCGDLTFRTSSKRCSGLEVVTNLKVLYNTKVTCRLASDWKVASGGCTTAPVNCGG
ncbi:hypothetical protein L210DRAFT_934922 [Boletus edulis BED1]|uniref:Uncharacterized protein n=1 Tax=Boletus edulis BED1 TaxID=1328754 RepID=A0AAD4BAC6_BOLED|nr:hypothetical protein L210DRAFT_934922 [Boletus edulis BED1]